MKNILVPTDLSVQSLHVVHEIAKAEDEKVKIYLFHLVHVPNDLSDLLFKRKSHLHAQVPNGFTEAIQLLKNRYAAQIAEITFCFYYGCRTSVVNSIIESNNIEAVYVLGNYQYKQPLSSSVNPVPLIEKCKLPVEWVHLHGKVFNHTEPGSFSTLLLNNHPGGITYTRKSAETVHKLISTLIIHFTF